MDYCDPVDINTMKSIGFLCTFDENTAKFYTLEYGLVPLENQDGDKLELASWYDLRDGIYKTNSESFGICKPYVKDGVVHVNTLAIGPNELLLPAAIRRKYHMKVWSPYLGYLNDASDRFRDDIQGGDVREVICKFAPSEEGVFEILDYIDEIVERSTAAVRLAPWTIEVIAANMDTTALPEGFCRLTARNHYNKPDKIQRSTGICIFHSKPNVAARKIADHKQGSHEMCSYIFSANMGLVRWTHGEDIEKTSALPEEHKNLTKDGGEDSSSAEANEKPRDDTRLLEHRLGLWVAFKTNDDQRKTEKKSDPIRPSIYRLTATGVEEFNDPPKVSRVVYGEVEIDASFIFNHDKLENPESRDIADWNARFCHLKKDAHFWDFDLGKVEFYPNIARQIIESIESYRSQLSPELRERLKEYAIVVHGTVRVLQAWLQNWKTYPEHGIFFMTRLNVICYLNGGATIHRREGFKK